MREDLTPCLIFPSLEVQAGGLTNAVRRRANFYAEHFAQVLVLTTDYQPDFRSVIEDMRRLGQLDPRVVVRNFFVDNPVFQAESTVILENEEGIEEPGLVSLADRTTSEPTYRLFRSDGVPVRAKRFRNGRLVSVDELDEGMRRVARDDYLEDGRRVRRRRFSPATGEPTNDTYYRGTGEPLATARVHPRKAVPTRTFVFHPEPEDLAAFTTLVARWVDAEISAVPAPVVSSDQRGRSDPILFDVSKAAKRVAVLHNNHYIEPMNPAAGVRGIFTTLFDHGSDVDEIVVLTEEQLTDLRADYPQLPFVHIGHAAPPPAAVSVDKDPNLVVLVGQLIERKRIDHAVRAFADVVQSHPGARLEVYGEGEEYDNLSSLVQELSLQQSVRLMGYSLDVAAAQQRAVCTLLTSTFEGSPLVIGESMANGTPMVAYDIKYGPRDVIRDQVDGILVTEHEPSALAQAIISLLSDPARATEMAHRAGEVSERFSVEEYERKWLDILRP